jgi:hypothetical protein
MFLESINIIIIKNLNIFIIKIFEDNMRRGSGTSVKIS